MRIHHGSSQIAMMVPTKAEIEVVARTGDAGISLSCRATAVRIAAQKLRDPSDTAPARARTPNERARICVRTFHAGHVSQRRPAAAPVAVPPRGRAACLARVRMGAGDDA